MEERRANIIFNKSGGTSTGVTNRVTIPTVWIKEMGISQEDRKVIISFDGEEIRIRKAKEAEE